MPTAKAIPANETILMERPKATSTTTEEIIEIGIAIAITPTALIERRNTTSAIIARKPPTKILL